MQHLKNTLVYSGSNAITNAKTQAALVSHWGIPRGSTNKFWGILPVPGREVLPLPQNKL